MPDFGRKTSGPGDPESLEDIARSDRMLDALASGQQRIRPANAGDAEILALLEGWRDGVRLPPAGELITEHEAAVAVQQGRSLGPTAPRGGTTRRHLAAVGSVAAAVLCIGGFGAVVAGAGPGDSLYGMRTALFGEPQSVRDDRVALAAQTEMAEVQRLIEQGDWDQAQQRLQTLTTSVVEVEDVTRQQQLVDEWNLLNVKVETRDPGATLPPPVPGDPALTLPVPASETSTSPSETTAPPSEATPQVTTEPTPTTSPETTPPSVSETPPTTTPPTTTAPTATPSTTTTPTTTPSTTTAPTTTAPTTTAPTTTTSPPTSTTTGSSNTGTTTATTTTSTAAPAEAEAPEEETPASSSTVVEAETETVPTSEIGTPETTPPSVQPSTLPAAPTTTVFPGLPELPVIELPIPGFS